MIIEMKSSLIKLIKILGHKGTLMRPSMDTLHLPSFHARFSHGRSAPFVSAREALDLGLRGKGGAAGWSGGWPKP